MKEKKMGERKMNRRMAVPNPILSYISVIVFFSKSG
jgi:hypothetical protein